MYSIQWNDKVLFLFFVLENGWHSLHVKVSSSKKNKNKNKGEGEGDKEPSGLATVKRCEKE